MSSETAVEKRASASVTESRPSEEWRTVLPDADIVDTPDEVTVIVDLPGISREQVEVHFEQGLLTLKGTPGEPSSPREAKILSHEFQERSYQRAFRIGDVIDAERIHADYTNGVLNLHLPKLEAVKPRKISVKGR